MKVKTITLSLTQEKKNVVLYKQRSINLQNFFIEKVFTNVEFTTKPFLKKKYIKNPFKFLSVTKGDILNEFIFTIKYKNKKDLLDRFGTLVDYAKTHGKPKPLFLSHNFRSDGNIHNILDFTQDLNTEFMQEILNRINSAGKVVPSFADLRFIGSDEQVGSTYIDKYTPELAALDNRLLNYLFEPGVKFEPVVAKRLELDPGILSRRPADFGEELPFKHVIADEDNIEDNIEDYVGKVIPIKEVFFIDYGTSYLSDIEKHYGPTIIDDHAPVLQVNSHFKGTKEQKNLLLKIREGKTKYAKFNSGHKKHNFNK